MGVSGAGKSTVGRILAGALGFAFSDADDLHPPRNRQLMESGQPLTDEDRWPWLAAVGEHLGTHRADGHGLVLACSALKRTYRDALREHVPDLFFVFLDGPMSVVSQRVNDRKHEFMPPELLASQYRTLEPLQNDEFGMPADIVHAPSDLVKSITRDITSRKVLT